MGNNSFYNGVNLVRAILEKACKNIDLGLVGQKMVMENLVDPMVDYLMGASSVVVVDGEFFDVLCDKLDEDLEIPAEVAMLAIERMRTVRRLINECVEVPQYAAAHIGNTMVVAVKSVDEAMEIMKKEAEIGEVSRNAEFLLSNALVEIYDVWCEEDLGDLHIALYNILKLGQIACDIGLSRLDSSEYSPISFEALDLQREGYEALEAVNERMDELLMDFPEYRNEAVDGDAYEGNGDIFGNGPIYPFS